MNIDWEKIKYFNPATDNFSENPDDHADPRLIEHLDLFREILGSPVHPSPAIGALARFDKLAAGSRHYARDKKSQAIDVFCEGSIQLAFMTAITSGLFFGVGIYFDTYYRNRPQVMMHLDIRPPKNGKPTIWYRDDGIYFYPYSTNDSLCTLLSKLGSAQ